MGTLTFVKTTWQFFPMSAMFYFILPYYECCNSYALNSAFVYQMPHIFPRTYLTMQKVKTWYISPPYPPPPMSGDWVRG